jgi:hypothetical protein
LAHFRNIVWASETAATRKVHPCHYVIFGGPRETEATIWETVEKSKQLPDSAIFAFSGMRVYSYPPLYKKSGTAKSAGEFLDPAYYMPDTLPDATRESIIMETTAGLPNWMLIDLADSNFELSSRLQAKGKQGPSWEYLAFLRRLNQPMMNQTQ